MTEVLGKVTAFVTRTHQGQTQLLVFRHPNAGIQLPAGTIEPGETPEIAVVREAQEETGLQDVVLLRKLGETAQVFTDTWRAVLRQTPIYSAPSWSALPVAFTLTRGDWVTVDEVGAEFSAIRYEEHNRHVEPAQVIKSIPGWLPTAWLSNQVLRHFFHLTYVKDTPAEWDVDIDRHIFHLYWTPLVPKPALLAGQDTWLDTVYEALRAGETQK